jgi:hypothetical protein
MHLCQSANGKWRCSVKTGGSRLSKVFVDKEAAERWGRVQEGRIASRNILRHSDVTLGDVVPKRVLDAFAKLPITYKNIVDSAIGRSELCGVYFLILGGEVVYIGQSKNVYRRIGRHCDDEKVEFDSFNVLPCHESRLDELESAYISALMPLFNMSLGRKRIAQSLEGQQDRADTCAGQREAA